MISLQLARRCGESIALPASGVKGEEETKKPAGTDSLPALGFCSDGGRWAYPLSFFMISRMKAGMSDGWREVIRLPSTTTSLSS